MRKLFLSLVFAALAGCGSAPQANYFVLEPVQPVDTAAAALSGPPLVVGTVQLPAALNRPEIVRRTGSNQIEASNTDRWGAPLEEMSRRVLAEDLAMRLPPNAVVLPGTPAPQDAKDLVVHVERFDGDQAGGVRLVADWTVAGRQTDPTLIRHETSVLVAGKPTTAGQAEAMSRALAELADHIAGTLAGEEPSRAD